MTWTERREVQRQRDARMKPKQYRCRYCNTMVDKPSRLGHLGRCPELPKKGASFARGAPVDEHFKEVKR